MASDAGAASRRADRRAGGQQRGQGAVRSRGLQHTVGCRDDDHPHVRGNGSASQDLGRGVQILQPAIRAGAQEDLVDAHLVQAAGRCDAVDAWRTRHPRLDLSEVDHDTVTVVRVVVHCEPVRHRSIGARLCVRRDQAGLGAHLSRHTAQGHTGSKGEVLRSVEFHRLVGEPISAHPVQEM